MTKDEFKKKLIGLGFHHEAVLGSSREYRRSFRIGASLWVGFIPKNNRVIVRFGKSGMCFDTYEEALGSIVEKINKFG